ncbi:hydrolase [Pseudooceanicola nanhaiensis]|jgi:pimeloyl-ACP methyl ester carboxylesterase|uniref:Hydrolase n=1 Tax=Pseudooceanicola nanhaiensis TaxID=375761 RepID=A0A917WCB2_9RHOB|nr:alpha/beta hydrolase [Pseudooceanicola nanhaiensis]GGL89400.1 hydrolase [Pseudooceanicola nanhaiensis]
MTAPRFSLVPVMDHELHVTEWGERTGRPLVMWHGLARTGRDFDELAAALSDEYFVICPDTIGRGLSSWSMNPEAEYSVEYYAGIAADLLDHYGFGSVGWLGTSMGGMIGMRLASGPHADRLACLLINDIGPEIPDEAIRRIVTYVSELPDFTTLSEAESWLRAVYRPFGEAGEAFWRRMARTSVRRRADGRLTLHYDPRITVQFTASRDELTTWDRFARITTPTHVFRGTDSDVLPAETAQLMATRGPRPEITEFPFGHAPTLSRPQDIALVRKLLARYWP